MILVIIPGAYSTRKSWLAFEKEMPRNVERVFLKYNAEDPIEEIIPQFRKEISKLEDDVIIVGHSLGGIIASSVAELCPNVKKVVTVATPYGGFLISQCMSFASIFVRATNNLWENTRPDNETLVQLRKKDIKIEITVFVAEEKFSTVYTVPSDGVVTVKSQKALGKKSKVIYKKINSAHIEANVHKDVIAHVKTLLL